MKKADNFFVRVKKYRRDHPRSTQEQAIKALKGKKVSGTATKKRVAGSKKVAGVKKITGTVKRKVSGIQAKASVTGTRRKAVSGITHAKKLITEIERLEVKRANERNRELKDLIQLQINANHDKLDALKRKYR